MDLPVIGKSLQAKKLGYAKPPILPMKRTDIGAGLGLDGRGGLTRIKFQEEAPVALSPTKERPGVTAFCRVEEVIVTRWDSRQQMTVLAVHTFLRLGEVVTAGDISDCLSGCDVARERRIPNAGFVRTRVSWVRQCGPPIARPDNDQSLSTLGHTVISRENHLPRDVVVEALEGLEEKSKPS